MGDAWGGWEAAFRGVKAALIATRREVRDIAQVLKIWLRGAANPIVFGWVVNSERRKGANGEFALHRFPDHESKNDYQLEQAADAQAAAKKTWRGRADPVCRQTDAITQKPRNC